ENAQGVREEFDISLVEVPVDVRFRLPTPLVKPYVLGGPVFRIANQDDENFRLNRLTIAGAAGVGLEVSALGFRPYIEARYQFGVQRFIDDFEIGNVEFESENDAKLNTFMLRLGLTF
ncbi:MAG TPA: PorT family protein, partial [Rhodothermales bacterium]|nr:PorT family protein [Rhodothermales bacterium]